jgi:hypothetical protein
MIDNIRRRTARGTSCVAAALLCACASAFGAGQDVSRPDAGGPPTLVHVGLYLADLHEVSAADQTFLADVILQADWRDPRLATHAAGIVVRPLDDVWNPRLQIVNQRAASPLLPQRVEIDASGLVRYRQRWMGRFSTRMNLRDFPLDTQQFHVQVVSLGYPRDQVDLAIQEVASPRATTLSLIDWNVGVVRVETADYEAGPSLPTLAGVQLLWEARRQVGYYAVQVVLPLVLIVIMAWTALWVDPSVVPARVSVSMTGMLTMIAYRFSLGHSVPNLTYLTRFDYFMLASTILVFLILMVVAAAAYLVGVGRTAQVRRLDRWSRLAFPVVFGAAFAWCWWG